MMMGGDATGAYLRRGCGCVLCMLACTINVVVSGHDELGGEIKRGIYIILYICLRQERNASC